ncbi:hypothetical protein [Kitasatospora sp. NPDC101183]|uniref:hypothetical protein n=1 Tax=Kitasatospora sp. NPDC101183 TaxID=3364100 RepID=UPI00380C068B
MSGEQGELMDVRRVLRQPKVVAPVVLGALLLAGGGAGWALSGGDGGRAVAVPVLSASPAPTPAPVPVPAVTPTVTPTPSEAPSPTPQPVQTAAAPTDADEPEPSTPPATRKPAPRPASTAKPKAPPAQDPHDIAPVPCTVCETKPQPGSGDCYPRGAGQVMVCGPVQTGRPVEPSRSPGH